MNGDELRASLAHYLATRRALGFKLTRDGLLLDQFVVFCEQAGTERITNELALAWVTLPDKASPAWLSMRLSVVRSFTRWLQAIDPATEVPERGWLPPSHRPTPYLYSDGDVSALLEASRHARWPLSAATYETLIGLVAITGMRVGEAIALDRDDVSLDDATITIRHAKGDNSRLVLLHPTTVDALASYLRRRAKLSPRPGEPAFFVHPNGNRVRYTNVQAMFRTFAARAGLLPRSARCRPTIHGLRHSFTVNTLVRWYREGVDVGSRLPVLSTWLGHADPKWTYWYLSAAPELLALAAQRLETWTEPRS